MKHTRISLLTWLLLAASVCATGAYAATVTKTIEFGQVEQYVEKSDYDAGQMADGNARTLVIYSGGKNTTTKLTAASDGYNSTAGATKWSNSSNLGTSLATKNHVHFSAIKGESVRLYYFSSSAIGKIHTFYLSHGSVEDDHIEGNTTCATGDKKLYFVDFTIPANGTYYISVNGGQNADLSGGTQISVSGIRFMYNEPGEVIASTVMTGALTCKLGGLYGDSIKNQVKTAAQKSDGTDITAAYDGKVGYRLNGVGNYVGVAVSGTTFKEGDQLKVFVTKVPSAGTLAVYGDVAGTELIYDFENVGVSGTNIATLPAAAEGKSVLYVARTSTNGWNGNIYSVEVMRAGIPYEMLFGYTWTATALSTAVNTDFDMTGTGILRAGTSIKGVSGGTTALSRSSAKDAEEVNWNMLALNKKDNYIELTTTKNLQAGDEIEIIGRAGGTDERGLYIEPATKTEYFSNSTTALETSKFAGQELHTSYKATVTDSWLADNSVTNTIRIFCSGKNIAVEKIEIIRHKLEITNVSIIGGSYNGTVLTEERIAALNEKKGATYPALEPSGADVRLTFAVTYMKDDDPEQTEVKNEEKVLTESGTDSKGNPKYTVTVGEQEYRITLQGYETIRTGLTEGKFGTMCLSGAVNSLLGATLYDIDWQNGSSIVLVEHTGAIEAGMPYIFEATESELKVCYKGSVEPVSTPGNHNGLYGTLEAMAAGSLADMYFVQNNEIRACSAAATLGANRAYINLSEVPTVASPAPGRRRVLGAPQVATDVEETAQDASVHKMLKDGKVYIVREGKTYTVDGRTVE